jgi:hypothetical protein
MLLPEELDATVELIHRVVGYPLAFAVAPFAIATFAAAPGHRRSGRWYAWLMTYLYVTGTILTLTRHEWGTWEFGRNVVFNLTGYSLMLYGIRAVWLLAHPEAPRRNWMDHALLVLLAVNAVTMTLLAIVRNTPLRIFSVIVIGLLVLEIRDWRAGYPGAVLYRRHLRYILASYFYVLTVVSLVHLRDEMSSDLRWLWPSAIGLLVIWAASSRQAEWLGGIRRARATRNAVRGTLLVGVLFGLYVTWELARDFVL